MIDLGATRDALAEVAVAALGERATVYSRPPVGTVAFPAVIVGLPEWEPTQHDLAQQFDRITFPVAVAMQRPGADDAELVDALESLWPPLLAAIDQEINHGGAFDAVCSAAHITRAYFDLAVISGVQCPSQLIEIDFY